ncbi:MAG TPA: FHA domain-containing protein [Vicinamibacteria bacterium]|nr:FHA domain-containing protein [Vicinamibacteria bacterium]
MRTSNREGRYPCLIVSTSDGKSLRHTIQTREATVGRDPSNDICIRDPLVSKFHAKLLVTNQSVTVVDLSSVNKTRVNGQVVTHATVRYGDEIQFARTRCTLVHSAAPETELEGVSS